MNLDRMKAKVILQLTKKNKLIIIPVLNYNKKDKKLLYLLNQMKIL
jgi:hypothetical protein